MVKVRVEIRNGAARFNVGVRAESVQQAVSFVKERHSKGSVEAKFTIKPESFFVEDRPARRRVVGLELPARVAA